MLDLELVFHKRSIDGSGKCTVSECLGSVVLGVLYEIAASDKPALDAVEGIKGYSQQQVKCDVLGTQYLAYLYVARSTHLDPSLAPYDWYKQLVFSGARHHRFPEAYISALSAVPSIPDPDHLRAAKNAELLRELALEGYAVEG